MTLLDDNATMKNAQRLLRVFSFARPGDDVDVVDGGVELLTLVPRPVVVNDTFLTVSAP